MEKRLERFKQSRQQLLQLYKYKSSSEEKRVKELLQTGTIDQDQYISYINSSFIIHSGMSQDKFMNIEYSPKSRLDASERAFKSKVPFEKSVMNLQFLGSYEECIRYLSIIEDVPLLFKFERVKVSPKGDQGDMVMSLGIAFYMINP